MYLNDIFTVTVNMAGLPLGLQLIGKPFDEETLFQTAYVIEQAAGRFRPQKWW
jgi:aspartyl-tRNA(Asn)/glutamyl-tRNA(Gln) amidotransferase subunit A